MSLLIETIRISNKRIYNIDLHQNRYEKSMAYFYPEVKPQNLRLEIKKRYIPDNKSIKCRLTYGPNIHDIAFEPYQIRNIQSIKIIENNEIAYPHKLIDRAQLHHLFLQKSNCDEILIVKNGSITDGYYYNIVLENEDGLFTPSNPLLHGVQRQKLIQKTLIIPTIIPLADLQKYKKIHLINAMTPLNAITLPISKIIY